MLNCAAILEGRKVKLLHCGSDECCSFFKTQFYLQNYEFFVRNEEWNYCLSVGDGAAENQSSI